MRIYTEVNFEWDDNQNQLVETSSKSFEYSGDMMLAQGGPGGGIAHAIDVWESRWQMNAYSYDPGVHTDIPAPPGYGTRPDLYGDNPNYYDTSFIPLGSTLQEAEEIYAEEKYGWEPGTSLHNVGLTWDQIVEELTAAGWTPYTGEVYEVDGDLYSTEEIEELYGEDINLDHYELEDGIWVRKSKLEIAEGPAVFDDEGDAVGADEVDDDLGDDLEDENAWLYADEPPDKFTFDWLAWVETQRAIKGEEWLAGYYPGWDDVNWVETDDGYVIPDTMEEDWESYQAQMDTEPAYLTNEWMTWKQGREEGQYGYEEGFDVEDYEEDPEKEGYWILREEEGEEPKTYIDAAGVERSEQWMMDHLEIDDEGNEIPFNPDDWEQLAAGGAYVKIGEDVPLGFGEQQSALIIEAAVADWKAIVDPGEADPFQDKVEEALMELGWAEQDVVDAFHDLDAPGGELQTLQDNWELKMERLMGATYEHPSGEIYTAAEALDLGFITEEEFDEMEGTYSTDIRTTEKEREEGLETAVLSREEGLETLREETTGEIRAAEAKVGAAGFAATGVGKSARDILAEEMGKEASDIEEGFVEEREGIETGYTEDIAEIERQKTDALTDYKAERDRLSKQALKPWEAASKEYERLLQLYGAVEGEEGDYTLESVTGGTEAAAEESLGDIQKELQLMVSGIRSFTDETGKLYDEDYDPFADPETLLSGPTGLGDDTSWADLLGWQPIGGTFTSGVTEGLFGETIKEKAYKPTAAFKLTGLYDPEYALPWEEDEYVSPWGEGG